MWCGWVCFFCVCGRGYNVEEEAVLGRDVGIELADTPVALLVDGRAVRVVWENCGRVVVLVVCCLYIDLLVVLCPEHGYRQVYFVVKGDFPRWIV